MLQSLSSFLPSTLQPFSSDKPSSTPTLEVAREVQPQQPPPNVMPVAEEQAVKKRKERTNESFIVVRPPPSKSNHPLNLQVQLVPPSTKERPSSRQSMDSTAEGGNDFQTSQVSLTRTASNRSDASLFSSYSSAGSISTVGSSSTTSSGRRMIIPLYNLQAHNVMQNVIVDAGTDAKIAKFMKRGLEVIGLALLEPIEVWGAGGPDEAGRRTSVDYGQGLSQEALHTPTSSAISLNTSEQTHDHGPPPMTPAATATPSMTPSSSGGRTGARKVFGRLFKRKEGEVGTPPPSPLPLAQAIMPPATTVTSADSTRSKRASLLSAHGPSLTERPEPPLQPPVLGIQPSLRSPTVPPRGRPTKYVWVVRKWLKGEPESVFSGVKDKFHETRNSPTPGTLESFVEVRIEWSRGKPTQKRGRGRDGSQGVRREGSRRLNRHSIAGSSATPSTASLQHPPAQSPARHSQAQKQRTLSPGTSVAAGRRSMDSARSVSPGPAPSVSTDSHDGARHREHDREDDGDDSDPEDSETPWTCTLVVRRVHAPSPSRLPQHSSSPLSPQHPPQSIRVKVAAVVPTPHHPKVVALLKVPFPLPDVEIERVALRKRIVTPAGIARPAPAPQPESNSSGSGKSGKFWSAGGKESANGSAKEEAGKPGGLMLTAEEIKDVVSCTGLWLVVREGFGGVGRERRKGDRWMLRG